MCWDKVAAFESGTLAFIEHIPDTVVIYQTMVGHVCECLHVICNSGRISVFVAVSVPYKGAAMYLVRSSPFAERRRPQDVDITERKQCINAFLRSIKYSEFLRNLIYIAVEVRLDVADFPVWQHLTDLK